MRCMEDVGALAVEHPGYVELFPDRIVGRRLEHRPEVRAELGTDLEVGLLAQQHVFTVAINACEVTQQIARVRPDAEIVELARVDRDPHCYCTVVVNPRSLTAIILVSLARQAIAQRQIRAENRQPGGVVLRIEGELTTTVRDLRLAR